MRGVGAVLAAACVTVLAAGWGVPLAPVRGAGDPGDARAVRALVAGGPAAGAALPPDLPERVAERDGLLVRAGGGCSSPLGGTPYGFTDACARHDLGYDVLRHAARRGDPLPGWARRALDDQLADGLAARCEQVRGGLPCAVAAGVYVAVVRVNTARQGAGAPLREDPVRWLGAVVAGLGAGGLVARAPVSLPIRAGGPSRTDRPRATR
jgi:hypothetical protein